MNQPINPSKNPTQSSAETLLRLGRYITHKSSGESFNAYVPPKLPPEPPLDLTALYPYLEKAAHALSELNSLHKFIPNTSLFVYMYLRKEALLSSQIEGTQSSFSDLILFENNQKPEVSVEDVEEVSNYIKAITYGLKRLREDDFPLSLRLLCEIHRVLLAGGRGSSKLPGEFRRSQNWIGGTRPGNALFVPPPVDELRDCLSDFENFMHDESLPLLIKAGLLHVQFETIHPFLDGNGRLGRLLITLLLCRERMLDEPILYLSLYLKKNRQQYYNLLQEVRVHGRWEVWLEFFLEGIAKSAKQAIETAHAMNHLFDEDLKKIGALGRIRPSCQQTLEYLKKLPQISAPSLAKGLGVSVPTARSALNKMVELGILEEITGQERDKVYLYRRYLNILEEGAEPL
jgi:Fic family protein